MQKTYKLSNLVRYAGTGLIILIGIILISLNFFIYKENISNLSRQLTNQVISSKKEMLKNIVLQTVTMINATKKSTIFKARKFAKTEVYYAYKIAENLYNKYRDIYPEETIERLIVEAIRPLRFNNGKGYFFIVKFNGKVLLNANAPSFEGKNFHNLHDNQGRLILKEMADIAEKNGEGYYTYNWHKPGDRKNFYKKISFVKSFKPLNFFIGTGIYPEDIINNLQKDLIKKIAAMRFGKEGYVFINKFDGTALITDGKIVKGGKKLWQLYKAPKRISEVKKIFQLELKAASKENGDYILCSWEKLTTPNKMSQMLIFIYGIKDWQWIVGSGVFLDDLEAMLKKLKNKFLTKFEREIIFSISSILICLVIFILITNKFSDFLERELKKLSSLFESSIHENKEIELTTIKIEEIKKFAKYINEILNEKYKILNNLQKSEEKFRKIFEYSTIPMLLLDKDRFIDCNNAAVEMLKAEKKEDLFIHPAELSPEFQPDGSNSLEKAKKIINEVYSTGKAKYFQWTHKRLNGEIFPSLISLCLVPYEDREVIFVSWIDISELKKLHDEVEREKEKLEVTLRSVGDAVITTDVEGKVEIMNKIAEELTGWTNEEARGKTLEEIFNIVNYYTRDRVTNPVEKVLKTGKIVGLANHTVLISKNGKEYHIADSAAPIKNIKDEIIGVVLVFRDVTEKIKQQEEIIKAEKLKSLGVIAGGIAHDFNNILTGITGNLSIMKAQLLENTVDIKKFLEKIDKMEYSLENAIHLTNQLLTFSKGGDLIKESINLKELIENITEFNLSGSNIKPVYNFQETDWNISADKRQLGHVISNLIINAKEAMDKAGKIYITVSYVKNPFINKEKIEGDYIEIKIQDEGKGISKTIINKIFDPFFTTKESGSGLGLATVYSIIRSHYGYITVESEEGKGTTFKIYLPAEKVKDTDKNLDEKKEKFIVSQYIKNVLIIDDNEMILDTTREIFHFLGVSCTTCQNGKEALEILSKNQFDLIITDLTIPGAMGGEEIINEILKIDPEAVVIVTSGYAELPIMSNYEKYGFKGRLLKPFTITTVEEELKRIFTQKK